MKRVFRSTDRRLVGAAVVSGLLLVPLGVFGSSALARTASGLGPSAAQYQYKVTVCHHTGSKNHPWHTIRISNRAVAAHLRHGDFVVTLTAPCPPKPGQVTTVSPTKHGHSESHTSSNSQNAQGKDNNSGGHGSSGHDNGHHGKS